MTSRLSPVRLQDKRDVRALAQGSTRRRCPVRSSAQQRARSAQRSVTPDELGALARPSSSGGSSRRQNADALRRTRVLYGIAGEDGPGRFVDRSGDDERGRLSGARRHQAPLATCGKPLRWRVAGDVLADRQHRRPSRMTSGGDRERRARTSSLAPRARYAGDAPTMTDDQRDPPVRVAAASASRPTLTPDSRRRAGRSPLDRVSHRVVRARSHPVLAAVLRPRECRSRCRHNGAESLVCDDVRPGQRRLAVSIEHDLILAAIQGEAADAVIHDHRRNQERYRTGEPAT